MIKVGDRLPEATFKVMTQDGPANRTTQEVFGGRKLVLFAVPGAFTPTCHRNHLPGYLENHDALKAKGVDGIVCVAVNDVFVLDAWAKSSGAAGKVEFLADGNADFARAVGLNLDASGFGMGTRSKRYAMLVDDGVVKALNVEDVPSKADISSAGSMLKVLEAA